MSDELRRLRRKQSTFTNFTGSQTSDSPEGSVKQIISEDTSNKRVRRRRRRQVDASAETNSISSQSTSIESAQQSVKNNAQDAPVTSASSPVQRNEINNIRAEIREDAYHARLAESDFSDDTHDWGGDSHDFSEDYWNFLGSFE